MKRAWQIFKKVFLWAVILQFVYLIILIWVSPPVTITQTVSWITGHGLQRDYIDYDEMGPNIKLAVIASEDQLFPDHDGFDVKAIKKAMKYNEKHPKKTRGPVPSASKQPRIFFCGSTAAGSAKGWKCILLL